VSFCGEQPLPQDLQDRGRHIRDTLQDLPLEQQLDLACRIILAVLLTFQPDRFAPKAKREAFTMICDGAQVCLKNGLRRCGGRSLYPKRRHRRPSLGSEWAMHKSIRILTVGPDDEPMQIRLCVQPIGERSAAMIVEDEGLSPAPGELWGQGFSGDTAEEAEQLAKAFLGMSEPVN
jgi:hypothetical protein